MWWQLLFFLAATAAASDEESEAPGCMRLIHQECSNDEPEDHPGTEEELREFCKTATEYFKCQNRILETCEERENEPPVDRIYIQELSTNIARLCYEDPLLFSAVVASLPCFKRSRNTIFNCPELYVEHMENFTNTLTGIGLNDVAAVDSEPMKCLKALYAIGCITSNAGKACDDMTRDVIINIIQGFDTPFRGCRPGVKEHLPDIARVMQIEAKNQEDSEDTMERKK